MFCELHLRPAATLLVALPLAVLLPSARPEASPARTNRLEEIRREIETLIPKRETGVLEFLQQHPTYDGRGVLVAIFDSGVDPAAPGLQTTTTGEPKIVDLIDASGAGDVDTSTTATLSKEGTLPGRTGRTLRMPEGLTNPKGVFFLGFKRADELLYGPALQRVREERQRDWEQKRRQLLAERFHQQRQDEAAGKRPARTKPESELTLAEKDLLARESLLENLEKNFNGFDPGPVYDCVVWHDGEHFNVLVDTDEDGDLRNETRLRPFGVAREYGSFGPQVGSHFAVQVYDEGKTLSLVTTTGSHGTHVAAIATAHFPEDPARNGIAPGARILSIKIGDIRLGNSSNGSGEMRAVAACARYGADLMNASWGGQSALQNGSNLSGQLYTRLVEEYGVIAFVSAGNNGPALSTLGSPGGETPAVIGVGAYVSQDMAAALYAVRPGAPDTAFHFTSRGPAKNGYLGVDIMGPGAAIATLARESQARSQLYNGTSMSSPSVAGVGALLVSAAKQLDIPVSPARIKAALLNSARVVAGTEVWAQGAGLAQAGPAFAHLQRYKDLKSFDLDYRLETDDNPLARGPGIYWRNPVPPGAREAQVSITPRLPRRALPEDKFQFSQEIVLEATQPWVSVPRYLHLTYATRTFRPLITVPPRTEAGGGDPLYAEIHGLAADAPEAGPLFRIPITIVQAQTLGSGSNSVDSFEAALQQGQIHRRFYFVPPQVSHLRLRLRRDAEDPNERQFMIHTLGLASTRRFGAHEFKTSTRLDPGEEKTYLVPVLSGRTTELCLHQLWSSLGPSKLQVEVECHGLEVRQSSLFLAGNQKYATLDLLSTAGDLELEVSARLTDAVYRHLPRQTTLVPADARDLWPPGPRDPGPLQQFVLRQKFEFSLDKPAAFKVQGDRAGTVDEELGGGFLQFFHETGKLLWQGGSRGTNVALPKGKVTAYRELRALDLKFLEKEKDRPLLLLRTVPGSATFGVSADGAAALRGQRTATLTLKEGRDYSLHFEDTALGAVKDFTPVPTHFVGEVRFSRKGETYLTLPIVYQRGEEPAEPKRPARPDPDRPSLSPEEKLKEDLFERKLALVRSLRHKHDPASLQTRQRLTEELLAEKPDHAPLYYEQAIALASRHQLLSTWHGGSRRPDKPAEEKKESTPAAEKADPPADPPTTPQADPPPPVTEPEPPPKEEPAPTKPDQPEKAGAEPDAAPAEEKPAAPAAEKPKPPPIPPKERILEWLDQALERLEPEKTARFFGATPVPGPEDAAGRKALEEERQKRTAARDLLRDVHLLRSDVLAHLDRTKEARAALHEAQRWEVPSTTGVPKSREPELALLEKEGHWGLVLQSLQDHFLKDDPQNRRHLQRRLEIYQKLGWDSWADRERLLLTIEKNQSQPRM